MKIPSVTMNIRFICPFYIPKSRQRNRQYEIKTITLKLKTEYNLHLFMKCSCISPVEVVAWCFVFCCWGRAPNKRLSYKNIGGPTGSRGAGAYTHILCNNDDDDVDT